ncbi:hypothetical protein PGT21_001260 [Puccinia graminis f. sp. tritici]|uniref:Nucleosome assembly protein n=2 Tax=Puccinia graminis f. sp. tritici TaxID=56615 RepID=E3LBW4_PUCGT|nr:uncharacterized protein PGTG_20033 [Puccinia graminis f. sp. tritici CRL 75-36-700-3]KAA1086488.1 hypothetical protein PGTUg99_023143 [Puccinia graminis f. sp. tritici]EFP94039.2 hypothetical protein PGTG_20033 [Puccinia graminis f. sp. tritici CRL 75-36-700-3]KAA1088937.1 hypothetical protein PGT21_001092 [Puccinia graminis f. sp. tritici]KAA1092400.1 hypothetical protein PGT21_001260 [Puccinia graminis f. sp. tritici]KAA1105092.1 hypothetical protein PGTUg99_006799 [Puccinia graminis f. s
MEARQIPQAEGDLTAPTPQNTPAPHSTISQLSRPQVPDTIGEDEEEIPTIGSDAATGGPNAQLANHPLLASLVQSRLHGLVGRSSGYIASLPPTIRQRIDGLNGIQVEHSKIEAEFQKEVLELEKKFAHKYQPLYERRLQIVTGKIEPSESEIAAGIKAAEEDEDDSDESDEDGEPRPPRVPPTAEELAQAPKGIPEFWVTVLGNHPGLSELVTERDQAALKHLEDIRVSYLDGKPGFKLLFYFGQGAKEFFENSLLEKTYYYQDEVGYTGDFVYDRAEGTKIEWKEGKDLTVKVETKKQRNKNTNQTRVVKKVVPTDSFFTFFSPPNPPSEDDDLPEEEQEEIEQRLELDYQIGEDLKDRIIPRAIDFFTGKALRYEDGVGEDFSDDYDEDDDDDDEDGDDDDDEDGRLVVPGAKKTKKAPVPPTGATPASHQDPQECKQQ